MTDRPGKREVNGSHILQPNLLFQVQVTGSILDPCASEKGDLMYTELPGPLTRGRYIWSSTSHMSLSRVEPSVSGSA